MHRAVARLSFGITLIAASIAIAPSAGAGGTVLGKWRQVWSSFGAGDGTVIEIRASAAGYEIVTSGSVLGGYAGDGSQISNTEVFTLDALRVEFPRIPEAVLRQVQGQAYRRFTFTLQTGGQQLTSEGNVSEIFHEGDRLTRYVPAASMSVIRWERIGEPPTAGGLTLVDVGSGVFTCYVKDGQRSGCLDVRNGSTRRVRVYLEGAPGAICTVDPGVYCSVPIAFGEYAVKVVADDEQGIGPTMSTRITMGSSGVRLAVRGDAR